MKNAHPSEFRANPERTPNELQTNSKTVPIQARFVVFSNGFCLSQLLKRAWIGTSSWNAPIQARCSSWDKQKPLEKTTKRAWIGTVLEFVWSSFGVRSGFARNSLGCAVFMTSVLFLAKNISISVFVSCGGFHLFRYCSGCLIFKRFC